MPRSLFGLKLILGVCIGLLLQAHAWTACADDQATQILQGITGKYGHLPGIMVSYERDILTKSMALLGERVSRDRAAGLIYFMPPNFLKVDQETPTPEMILSDGDTLWWHIPQKNQVYRYPSNRLGKELGLLTDIFRGLKRAEENFDISILESDTGALEENGTRIKLIPNPLWPDIDFVVITVTKKDFFIRAFEIYNTIGSRTRFRLSNLTIRETFEKGFFRFEVPAGTRLIEEEETGM